jgi:hypothetical protein
MKDQYLDYIIKYDEYLDKKNTEDEENFPLMAK